jgi:hypothetical protein
MHDSETKQPGVHGYPVMPHRAAELTADASVQCRQLLQHCGSASCPATLLTGAKQHLHTKIATSNAFVDANWLPSLYLLHSTPQQQSHAPQHK